MPFELLHFRESDRILKNSGMEKEVSEVLRYIDDVLYGSFSRSKLMREALQEMGWRDDGTLNILEDRGYQYKGYKHRIGIEGNMAAYEYILEGLFRLQIGFDKGKLDTGILLLTGLRGEKTPYGSTVELCQAEVEDLYPTISMPVSIALFDVGEPGPAQKA